MENGCNISNSVKIIFLVKTSKVHCPTGILMPAKAIDASKIALSLSSEPYGEN